MYGRGGRGPLIQADKRAPSILSASYAAMDEDSSTGLERPELAVSDLASSVRRRECCPFSNSPSV
jgi:hypothetical protein